MASARPSQTSIADIDIVYVDEFDGFFCYRVGLSDVPGMDALMIKNEIGKWLLERANGRYFMGNGFGTSKDHPAIVVDNPGGRDVFVLLQDIIDTVQFDTRFAVKGITPTLLMDVDE